MILAPKPAGQNRKSVVITWRAVDDLVEATAQDRETEKEMAYLNVEKRTAYLDAMKPAGIDVRRPNHALDLTPPPASRVTE